jgi:hypothetical protein
MKGGHLPELFPKGRQILSTLTIGAFALAGLYTRATGPREPPKPKTEITAPAPKSPLGIYIIGPSIDGKVRAIGLEVPEQTRPVLMPYAPLWYEIEELQNLRTDVPIERGKYSATTHFTSPLSIDGMMLKFYGTDPETKKPKLLQSQKLPKVTKDGRQYY